MKQVFLIFAFLFITFQSAYSLKLDIGGKGGIGFGTQNANGTSQTLVFHGGIGATAELRLFDFLSVEGNILYHNMGARYSKGTLDLDYFQFPILAKLYFYNGFWVGTGINPGILIGSDFTSNSSFSSFDFGLLLAFGEKFPLNKDETLFLTADVWINFGLIDVIQSESGDNLNRSYVLYFGVLYRMF